MNTTIPELVCVTGGIEPVVGALVASRREDFGFECMQCLDAPMMMAAGSTREVFTRDDVPKRCVSMSVCYRD